MEVHYGARKQAAPLPADQLLPDGLDGASADKTAERLDWGRFLSLYDGLQWHMDIQARMAIIF